MLWYDVRFYGRIEFGPTLGSPLQKGPEESLNASLSESGVEHAGPSALGKSEIVTISESDNKSLIPSNEKSSREFGTTRPPHSPSSRRCQELPRPILSRRPPSAHHLQELEQLRDPLAHRQLSLPNILW